MTNNKELEPVGKGSKPLDDEVPKSALDKYGKIIGYIAASIFIVLGIAYCWMYLNIATTATEQYWSRFISLLPVIEALIFSSAGFIFGKEVHREQAEKADKRADKEGKRANIAEANGKVLKNGITDFARRHPPQRTDSFSQTSQTSQTYKVLTNVEEIPVLPVETEMESDLKSLVDKANYLFPDQRTV